MNKEPLVITNKNTYFIHYFQIFLNIESFFPAYL